MRIEYNAGTVFGAMTQQAVSKIIRAQAEMARLHMAMDVATNVSPDPRDYTKLEGGVFGVEVGKGLDFWNTITSIKDLLAQVAPVFLAQVDNGG